MVRLILRWVRCKIVVLEFDAVKSSLFITAKRRQILSDPNHEVSFNKRVSLVGVFCKIVFAREGCATVGRFQKLDNR